MNAKRIEILRMEASHAEAAAEIEKEVFSMPWSREAFVDSLKNPDVFYLAAMVQGELAGYCGFFQSFEEAEITGVAVGPRLAESGNRIPHAGRTDPPRRRKRRIQIHSGGAQVQ